MTDRIATALSLLASGNPAFDQIMWDPDREVLSFRRSGVGDYYNLWLDRPGEESDHHWERNGQPAAGSEVLWQAGQAS